MFRITKMALAVVLSFAMMLSGLMIVYGEEQTDPITQIDETKNPYLQASDIQSHTIYFYPVNMLGLLTASVDGRTIYSGESIEQGKDIVFTAIPNGGNAFTQEVQIPIGENYYIVDSVTYAMDAEAYISPTSESAMVPARYIANAFGLIENQDFVEDIPNGTLTINAPNGKIIRISRGKLLSTNFKE